MIDFTQADIIKYHDKLRTYAYRALRNGETDRSMELLATAAKLAYNFNYFYTDPKSEALLRSIAKQIDDSTVEFAGRTGRYVFIDTNGRDGHGLTLQYLRALMALDIEFLYIYKDPDHTHIPGILQELEAYPKAKICLFEAGLSPSSQTRTLLEKVRAYAPEKILLHLMPWDVSTLAACCKLPGVPKYNINLTDHAYWLGAECIDYNIEFRDYGATVSLEKRHLKPEQLLLLPYYPIVDSHPFAGFPAIAANGKVVILSGGAFYKIYGEREQYFEIIRRLLEENPEAVVLYVGFGDERKLRRFIKRNKFQDRISILGYRHDINEVFAHSDLFLGTYPISGGLMTQYAAINGKPILAYTDPKFPVNYVESLICHTRPHTITFTDTDWLLRHAHDLCSDKQLRERKGAELMQEIITPEIFAKELRYLLTHNRTERTLQRICIDYDAFSALYLDMENRYVDTSRFLLLGTFRWRSLLLFPKVFIKTFPKALLRRAQRIFRTL